METNWNQLIERYLNGELSAEGTAGFETELEKNPELKQEFELHQLTQDIIKRASTRSLVQQSAKSYHLKKTLTTTGIVVLALAIAAWIFFLKIHVGAAPDNSKAPQLIEKALLDKMNQELQFGNIDPQYFKFTGQDDVFLSESGVLLSITDQSFLLNGKPYHGEAVVQWQEAQTAAEIVKAGLSTVSGDKLLETQGMFSLNAFTPEGKQLQLSNTGIYVQVPVDELKKDMMLFNGVKGKDGNIDWQTPVEMERLPKPKSMAKMDLFPPKYEPKLNELKWFTDKAKRDSLYLSFDETTTRDTFTTKPLDLFNVSEPEPLPNDIPQPNTLLNDIPKPTKSSGNPKGKGINLGGAQFVSMLSLPQIQDTTWRVTTLGANSYMADSPQNHVTWNISLEKITGTNEAWIVANVSIEKGWYIGAIHLPKGNFGVATALSFEKSEDYELIGKPLEPKPITKYDQQADENVCYHEGNVIFKQKIKIHDASNSPVSMRYTYLACNQLDEYRLVLEFSNDSIGKPIKKSNQSKTGYCLPPFTGHALIFLNSGEAKNHIPPSKVLAIWDKKFDNTILATQDFEDRMKVIHNTCDERVFDVYVSNLNEPLWKLDERVVKMGYPEFQKFADQKVGCIKLKDEHQKNLHGFYQKALQDIQSAGKKNMEAALKKERQWDQEVQAEREKETMRKGMRESANLNEEYAFNLQNVYKQLGTTVAFQMHGGGTIVNIDKYVMDATIARQSTLITDPQTGKTAKITYNPIKLEVNDAGKYDRLYVYLFSTEINSYQRLDFKNGKLDYHLNGDMNYTAAIVGINDTGYFFQELGRIKAKNLGAFSLKQVSAAEFDNRINAMNNKRMDKPMELKDELNWLFKEQANYVVQKQRKDMIAFRTVLYPLIYTCGRMANVER